MQADLPCLGCSWQDPVEGPQDKTKLDSELELCIRIAPGKMSKHFDHSGHQHQHDKGQSRQQPRHHRPVRH